MLPLEEKWMGNIYYNENKILSKAHVMNTVYLQRLKCILNMASEEKIFQYFPGMNTLSYYGKQLNLGGGRGAKFV